MTVKQEVEQMSQNLDPILLREENSGICTLSLNAPNSINALSEAMLIELTRAFEEIGSDTNVKAVILRSTGTNFCAGHNLKEMSVRREDEDGGFQYFQDLFATCSKMMLSIVHLPQPVIAQVQGIATAAGCQLVASCDLAVASNCARFATSGVNIGLFCSTPMVALSRNIARKQAMEMLLLGEFIPAERAAQMGLVNRCVALDELENTSIEMAKTIAEKSPAAIKLGKRAFYDQAEMTLEKAYEYAGKVMATNMMAQDAENGIGAFISKKPTPQWSGK